MTTSSQSAVSLASTTVLQSRFNGNLDLVLTQLAAPFPPSQIAWRTVALGEVAGSPVARVRPYVPHGALIDRLNGLLGMGWTNQAVTRAGETTTVSLVILGQSARSGTGETFEAAFAEAAMMFGMGRYLTEIPTQTVDYVPGELAMPDVAELLPALHAKKSPVEYLLAELLSTPDLATYVRAYLDFNRLWTVEDVRGLATQLYVAKAQQAGGAG